MSKSKFIRVTEVAKLIRQALREALPDIKFSVRCAGGGFCSSVHVGWVDGPNRAQVEAIVDRFQSSYYDTQSDYWQPLYHRMNGEPVSFGSDIVSVYRRHSETWIASAIETVFLKYQAWLDSQGIARPTLADYRAGRLHDIWLGPKWEQVNPDDHWLFAEMKGERHPTMYEAVSEVLAARTDRESSNVSAIAGSVTLLAGDNPAVSLAEAGWVQSMH